MRVLERTSPSVMPPGACAVDPPVSNSGPCRDAGWGTKPNPIKAKSSENARIRPEI